MNKQILFLTRWIPPRIDGVADYTWKLVTHLRNAGYDARIATSADQPVSREGEGWVHPIVRQWSGEEIAGAIRSLPALKPEWCCLQYVAQMYGRAGFCPELANVSGTLKKHLNCRVAVTFHEVAVPWGWLPQQFLPAIWTRLQVRRLFEGCDQAVTTSERYVRMLQTISRKKIPISMIPVGCNILPVAADEAALSELRRRYGLTDTFVLGAFGRLTKERPSDPILSILAQANKENKKAALLWMGAFGVQNSPEYARSRALARRLGVESQIHFTGKQPEETLSKLLQLVDLYVLPDRAGLTTGRTGLMTALAHGVPALAFRAGGDAETPGIPGVILAASKHEDDFVQKAMQIIGDPASGRGLSEKSTQFYDRHFSWEAIGYQYAAFLGES